jgi:flagellin-specific chaperone FliS
MRGSTPLSRSMSKQQQTITKQLQNLYSWTQFYQERGNKDQIRKCQTQIAELKKAYNQTKTKKNG